MNLQTTIAHTVKGHATLCGIPAPPAMTCTRSQLDRAPWVSCPLCTLAKTCTQIDQATAPEPPPPQNPDTDRKNPAWKQPTLF